MNALERLIEYKKLIAIYEKRLSECVVASGLENDAPAIALDRAFQFGRRTIDTIANLLQKKSRSIFARILCRPFYELSVRLLWASRETGGWNRLRAYFVDQDRKWADDARLSSGLANHANRILSKANKALDERDSAGKKYELAPSIEEMLRNVKARDCDQGFTNPLEMEAKYEYANVYRVMTRPVHAHMGEIIQDRADVDLRHVVVGCGLATFALLRTVCHCAATDEKAEIECIGQRISELLNDFGKLSFDDFETED